MIYYYLVKFQNHFACMKKSVLDIIDVKGYRNQRRSWEKVLWKYASNLQENTHAEGWSPVKLLHICRTHFHQNISGGLTLRVLQTHVKISHLKGQEKSKKEKMVVDGNWSFLPYPKTIFQNIQWVTIVSDQETEERTLPKHFNTTLTF